MAIHYKEESWEALSLDLQSVWEREHVLEMNPHPNIVQDLALDMPQFAALAAAGLLYCGTARIAQSLVGYYVSVQAPCIMAKGHLGSSVLLYYVRPWWRKQGIGRQLFAAYEAAMQRRGVRLLTTITKTQSGHAAFLDAQGWYENERVFTKVLEVM